MQEGFKKDNSSPNYKLSSFIWAAMQQNLSSGVSDKSFKPVCSTTESK